MKQMTGIKPEEQHSEMMHLPIGKKIFEEIDTPTESRIVGETKIEDYRIVFTERESRWTGDIKGYNTFPSGKAVGSGRSLIYNSGVTISDWQ